MKTLIVSIAALALTIAASDAVAQPGNAAPGQAPHYAAPPPPPAPTYVPAAYPLTRRGLTLGGDFGIGSMSGSDGLDCFNCEAEPPAVAMSGEIGGMLSPRFALLLHGRWTGRALSDDGSEMLHNTMGLVVGKWWFTRRFWVKGGLGVASTSVTVDDGFDQFSEELGSGGAGLLAVGFEIVHSRRFALDLALTGTSATINENDSIDTGVLSLGVSWF